MAAVKKVGQKNCEVGHLVEYLFCVYIELFGIEFELTSLSLIWTACVYFAIYEDNIFRRQNILYFFSGVLKYYKYVKSSKAG